MKATTEKAFGANLQSVFSNPCEKWQTKKLGEIFSIERGGSPRPIERYLTDSQDGINWIKISDTRDITKYIYTTKEKIIPDGVKRSRMVYEGDFILSNSMSFGRPYIMKTQGCIHDGWLVLRNNQSLIDNDFLYYVLSSDFVYQQFNMLAYGSTVRNLNIGLVQKVKIPVPPLPEQHRIVSILDKAFTEIDKAKKNTEENIKKNKELFEAKFRSVFANLGSDWKEDCIGNLCDLMTGGTPSRTEKEYFDDGDIPWLVSGDVNTKEIFDCEGRITELGMKNSNAKYLPINSVLIALNGQGKTRGTVAKLRMKATCNQSIVSIYPKDLKKINADYIYHNLNARYQEIRKITSDSGNDRRGLNMPLIKNIKVSYPSSLQEQLLLVQKFDKMQNERSNLELIYNQKLTHLEELKKSILKQAFEGKL